jgi:hypothetical protein
MLALFCLRLAGGLIAALLIISPQQVHARFYRVQFLTALGLTALAAVLMRDSADAWLWTALASGLILEFVEVLAWSVEGLAGKQVFTAATASVLATALLLAARAGRPEMGIPYLVADELTSAALLGTATTAMLMGHSYLVAPAMSLIPLLRLLQAVFLAILLRVIVAGLGMWFWTAGHSLVSLEDETVLWLPVRWGLGFAGPLVLVTMAWKAAKIRSTQSATGILYVVVIFCFLGELTSQLLATNTGYTL